MPCTGCLFPFLFKTKDEPHRAKTAGGDDDCQGEERTLVLPFPGPHECRWPPGGLPNAGQHGIGGGRGHHAPVGSLGCRPVRQRRCKSSHSTAMQSDSVRVQLEAQVLDLAAQVTSLRLPPDSVMGELNKRDAGELAACSPLFSPDCLHPCRTIRLVPQAPPVEVTSSLGPSPPM